MLLHLKLKFYIFKRVYESTQNREYDKNVTKIFK